MTGSELFDTIGNTSSPVFSYIYGNEVSSAATMKVRFININSTSQYILFRDTVVVMGTVLSV